MVYRTIGADSNDVVVILKTRPVNFLAFDHADLHASTQWHLNGRARNFAITHRGMAIAQEEHGTRCVYRKVNGVANTRFRRIHVAAEGLGHHRTSGLAAGGRHAATTKERM